MGCAHVIIIMHIVAGCILNHLNCALDKLFAQGGIKQVYPGLELPPPPKEKKNMVTVRGLFHWALISVLMIVKHCVEPVGRCIPRLRREQPIVNGAEESEGRKRRGDGADNTPIFARKMRGLGVQEREEDSSSCQSIKVGVTVSTSWSLVCYSWGAPLPPFSFWCCSSACRRGCAACRAQPLSFLLSWCHIGSGEIQGGLGPYRGHARLMSVKVGQVPFMCWSGPRFPGHVLLGH